MSSNPESNANPVNSQTGVETKPEAEKKQPVEKAEPKNEKRGKTTGKTGKKVEKKAVKKTSKPKNPVKKESKGRSDKKPAYKNIPECSPYRPSSAYAVVFSILHKNREKGITRGEVVKEAMKVTGKDQKRAYFDMVVVSSPNQDGSAHRSANGDTYWVEKFGDSKLRLHMRPLKKA